MTGADGLAGSVRWAVVPFTPRPPFRLYAGEGHAPIVVDDVEKILSSARTGGDAELTYLVPGKARPVVVLNEPSAHHRDVTALRLLRLSRLDSDERAAVRRQEEELLFYLTPERFSTREESAAMVSALVRLDADAIAPGPPLGTLQDDEMRVLGERIITFYGFDTSLLVERHIRELIERRGGGRR